MNYAIEEIEGIAAANARKLAKAGVTTTAKLLEVCATPKGRKATAETTGLREDQLLKWANHADLMRVKGIGKQYADLLEAAGVDTVKELRTRNPANLAEACKAANAKKTLTRITPAEKLVARWVAAAKELTPMLKY
jgi:predicted flap endonuclease-1-like 5' DNA nuclease